jgi:membrane protein
MRQLQHILDFIKEVGHNFDEHECALRAASLAYYALFSIFPLLLLLVYLGGEFLTSEEARRTLDIYTKRVFPVSSDYLQGIIDQIMAVRGPIGIVGGLGLIWSSSSVFGVLEWSLSIIWRGSRSSFWRRRFLATVAVLILSVLFLASFSLRPLVEWLWSDGGLLYKDVLNITTGIGMGTLVSFLLFRIFPNRNIAWKHAMAGALFVSISIEASMSIIEYYLNFAFMNFGNIYGSLAWIVTLGIWVYLVGLLLFLGAEFGSTLDQKGQLHTVEE